MKIENIIDKDFSGVISIKKNENIIYQKAYGFADLPNKVSNKVDTKFATASAGKVFVATGILNLIEKNKLFFNSHIGDILDFNLKCIDPKITIRQLLNHTSGIPDYFDESVMGDYSELWKDYPNYKIRTSSDLLSLFINKQMMYPAGEKFKYNNSGYVILGLIIEKLSNLPFDKYLAETIFKPCDITNTGYFELDRLPANCANSYIYDENRKEYYTNIYSVDVKGTGAGGAFTTITDIEKFWFGLLDGKVISKAMVQEMLSPQIEEYYYGYGVWLNKKKNNKYNPYFEGSDPGVSFISSFDIEENMTLTLASNFGCNVWTLHKELCNLVLTNEFYFTNR